MGHAHDANAGNQNDDPSSTGLETNEAQASHFENQVRSELGLPLRLRYGGTYEFNPETGEYIYVGGGHELIKGKATSTFIKGYNYSKENPPVKE